jgi:hypothetical protein
MKDKEKGLLYHTMHSRPMPGCLPLFFLLALGVTALCLWIAPVKMPERVRSKGVGEVYVKEDRLTHFLLRRQSPLPLHLPNSADPEYQEDVAAAAMPLLRPSQILPPPPLPVCPMVADSAVLDAAALLELPGEAAPVATTEELPAVVEPAPVNNEQPVFHPGVEKEMNGEEVQP